MVKHLKIGLLGLGVVGSGVVQVIAKNSEKIFSTTGIKLEVVKALVRAKEEKQALASEYGFSLVHDSEDIMNDPEIDIVVEVMGKIEPAKTFISAALNKGKHVVSANKDLIAQYGNELVALAQQNGCYFYYEASVAGGIPILRTLVTSFLADEITEIFGIVNGTTNYMLTQMVKHHLSYEDSLKQAQKLGFAESDPTNDVDGIDAAYKAVILTRFAFQQDLGMNDFTIQGIREMDLADLELAQRLGYEVKLIARIKNSITGVYADVAPKLIPQHHPLASVSDELNGVFVKSKGIGESMFYGPGAGSLPTATSVVNDLAVIAQRTNQDLPTTPFIEYKKQVNLQKKANVTGRFYLALKAQTKAQIAKMMEILAKAELGLELVEQKQTNASRFVYLTKSITLAQRDEVVAELTKAAIQVTQTMEILEE
ncbi:homoserine dehydrogenase [Enterococcus saigonensis]|uniref:Homoserine dehydrogenase n=1 Tax=Enterococcus saigonensis TaxID=1805431 RepID=A0A679INJ9_9ENTE|nr:homoserine dehydrogenase [Enterococcus saigonensis]BCA85384.1 homoserine dehydrogenase [Enterococcus saigonensis]